MFSDSEIWKATLEYSQYGSWSFAQGWKPMSKEVATKKSELWDQNDSKTWLVVGYFWERVPIPLRCHHKERGQIGWELPKQIRIEIGVRGLRSAVYMRGLKKKKLECFYSDNYRLKPRTLGRCLDVGDNKTGRFFDFMKTLYECFFYWNQMSNERNRDLLWPK